MSLPTFKREQLDALRNECCAFYRVSPDRFMQRKLPTAVVARYAFAWIARNILTFRTGELADYLECSHNTPLNMSYKYMYDHFDDAFVDRFRDEASA